MIHPIGPNVYEILLAKHTKLILYLIQIQTKVIYDTVSTPVCRRIPKTVCSPTGCTETGCEDSRYPVGNIYMGLRDEMSMGHTLHTPDQKGFKYLLTPSYRKKGKKYKFDLLRRRNYKFYHVTYNCQKKTETETSTLA